MTGSRREAHRVAERPRVALPEHPVHDVGVGPEAGLRGVLGHFGRRRAVSHVSFDARSGDIIGLLGPNGAGKSTLIGMLATLVAPTSGTVTYGGQPARALGAPLRGSIGLLAHELYLYPELTARQNLEFFASLYGLDVRTDLGGLNLSVVPKVLIETANMRNATDARRLESAAYRQREAVALARGLEAFLS